MAGPGSLTPATEAPNQSPQVPTVDLSSRELCHRIKVTRGDISTLIKDTKWPRESEDIAQDLLQIINNSPDLPAEIIPVKDSAKQSVQILEAVHATVKEASEKYGTRERGFREGIKFNISSLRPSKCTDTLRTCREDSERVSAMLSSWLESLKIEGNRSGSEVPSGVPGQPNAPLVKSGADLEPSKSPPGLQPKPEDSTAGSDQLASQGGSVEGPSADSSLDQETRSPVRDRVIIAARKTFETVETVSGTIPVVGNFVGVAAKVGLAFVNMIETMDKNEDVAKDLAHHTSKLSSYIEHFKKKSDAGNGDELATHVDNLHKELECVQKKVSEWDSTGRLKKAFLSGDHAEELKAHQDEVQTALEELQLLVSLKTADVVIELKNTELRAERRRLLACLGDGSYGARGNSIEEVSCLPGTRVEILERIDTWIKDTSDAAERVLWIRGMAGRGKSTIASTVAHDWASKGSCAIFHFRRGHNASDGQFICALARQLGKGLVPEVKNAVLDCVRDNEDIAKARLDVQFKTLFVGSFRKLQDHAHPIIIIVDALDECKNVADTVRFVRLIDQHSSFLPKNIRFLLTCRPEAPLLVALEPRKWHAEDLDSIPRVLEDITRFVQNACTQIRDDHDLPETWPSPADLKAIVEMSQGLFQWARTALSYIHDRAPEHRLQELLQSSSTWSGLDDLYHQIFSKAFNEVETNSARRQLLSWVLGTLVVAPHPVSLEVIAFLYADHAIFKSQKNVVQFLRKDILADLNSLLLIPASSSEPMHLMHTSIRDLLLARERCEHQRYFINPIEDHRRLAGVSLQVMARDLKQNICDLPHFFMANSKIQDKVDSQVSKGLRYCCRSWHVHLTAGVTMSETTENATSIVPPEFKAISEQGLMFWLEVMSLIGALNEAGLVAKQVYQWLLTWPNRIFDGPLVSLWRDVQRFIATFFEPISYGALHIYASALPHCPVETKLWGIYHDQATTRMLLGKRQLYWGVNIWTSWTRSAVRVAAFSPDGSFLASGLEDGKIQLLDAQTGARLDEPLTGHSGWIASIVFSPNGRILASGSHDHTVRLWDTQIGAPLGEPLTGHSDWVASVVISPDGKVLASGSGDKTIRLWDVPTGAPLGEPLIGHSDWIASVLFSPDGKVLASGSQDKTVRLWDAHTGAPLGDPLIGHSDGITSLVFSSNSKVVASGSRDKTVRLWDAQTGSPLGQPLTGHSKGVTSLVFLPQGKALASGSLDNTVQLWDVQTGTPLGDPFTGHSDWITSVVVSSDGKVLASGSGDGTIRLWDVRTGALLGEPLIGHMAGITSVIFSPDNKALASGSIDSTVKLWDVQTRTPFGDGLSDHRDWTTSVVFPPNNFASTSGHGTVRLWDGQTGAPLSDALTGHCESISRAVFSPDGKLLASGSSDKTIQLWDAQTGTPLGEPLASHDDSVTSIHLSPDNKFLAWRPNDETIRLWDVRAGAPLGEPLTGGPNYMASTVFSPDSKVLVSASHDMMIRLWDTQTGAPLGESFTGHSYRNTPVVFSPDSKVLAFGSFDRTVQVWDALTGERLGDPLIGHSDQITSIRFSPDGKVLASISRDKTVLLWDVRTGARLGDPLSGYGGLIELAVFLPYCNTLPSMPTGQIQDSLPNRLCESLRTDPTSQHFKIESFVFWNSERLLWLPGRPWSKVTTVKLSPIGGLAVQFRNVLSVYDISRSLKL